MTLKTLMCIIVLLMLSFEGVKGQSIPLSSYSLLSDYTSNPYFNVINKKVIQSYPSYLTQSTVSSVQMYSTSSLVSFIITYTTRSGSLFRATVVYTISTKQLNILSFGPVAQRTTSSPSTTPNRTIIDNNDPGIGITKTPYSPNRQTDYIVQSGNPAIINRNQSTTRNSSTSSNSTINRPGQTNYIRRGYYD